jgi:glucosamine-6-phosphate deaminase
VQPAISDGELGENGILSSMVDVRICSDKGALGEAAAVMGAQAIREAIAARGEAAIIVATGASQFDMLARLVETPDIDWSRVTAFHLDEYVGLPASHPASFRRYLRERFVEPLSDALTFVPVDGDSGDAAAETARLGALIAPRRIDVCFAGIGENCHLAFNDPPADFKTEEPYIVVELDEACRRQQFGEGWFASLDEVPKRAISMGIRQILKSRLVILSVSDRRKAAAVRDALESEVTPLHPASIVRRHDRTVLFLDPPAASLLRPEWQVGQFEA